MIPLAAALVLAMLCGIAGYFANVLVHKIRNRNESSEFIAYSDEELERQRASTAKTIRFRIDHGYRTIVRGPMRQLVKIDREIARRAAGKSLAIENGKSAHDRALAEFEAVYGMVLKDVENKEKK